MILVIFLYGKDFQRINYINKLSTFLKKYEYKIK
jgi:hypothetical protein